MSQTGRGESGYLRDVVARTCVSGLDRFDALTPANWKAARTLTLIA